MSKSQNQQLDFPDSFKEAKKNFSKNFQALLDHFGYTVSSLILKINSTVQDADGISVSDAYEWLAGTRVPNIYQLYKMSRWLNIPMDLLFKNYFDTTNLTGKSFAIQSINYSVSEEELVTNSQNKEPIVAKNTVVSISRNSKKQMLEVVTARTDSKNYNLLLANKLYNSDMQLKDIAAKVGVSTRSLRDYAFYGTSVPTNVAENLVKIFKTSYRNLGLQYDDTRDRYTHMSVKVKA